MAGVKKEDLKVQIEDDNILEISGESVKEEEKGDDKSVATMKEEMMMIGKNQIWVLVEKSLDRKIIGVKWVFRTKLNPNGYP